MKLPTTASGFFRQIDAEQLVRNNIREMVDDHEMVRDELPDGWSPSKGIVIVVQGDGTTDSQTAFTEELVRVSVHGESRPDVRSVMSQIDDNIQGNMFRLSLTSATTVIGLMVTPSSLRGGYVASVTYKIRRRRIG